MSSGLLSFSCPDFGEDNNDNPLSSDDFLLFGDDDGDEPVGVGTSFFSTSSSSN